MPEWRKPFEFCASCVGSNTQGRGFMQYLTKRLSEIKVLESITGSTGIQYSRVNQMKSVRNPHDNDN